MSENALATTEEKAPAKAKPKDQVRQMLDKMAPEFQAALPAHLPVDRLLRVTMNAISTTPKLLNCDRMSLLKAVMTSAQLGLEPNGPLGQAYLIPFGNQVQFIVGYKGLLSLARNSGEVQSITAQVVRENDEFNYSFGLDEKCDHIPLLSGDRGAITHVYAIARFKDGGHYFDVMSHDDILNIRNSSQGFKYAEKEKKDSPWHLHFEEMARKTVIRRISKYLPMSVQKAAELETQYDLGRTAHVDKFGDVIVDDAPLDALEDNAPIPQGAEDRLDALEELADKATEEEAPEDEVEVEETEETESTYSEQELSEKYDVLLQEVLKAKTQADIKKIIKENKAWMAELPDNLYASADTAINDAYEALKKK